MSFFWFLNIVLVESVFEDMQEVRAALPTKSIHNFAQKYLQKRNYVTLP